MNILDRIIADKIKEVSLKKSIISSTQLEQFPLFGRNTHSISKALQNSTTGIIAEHKRRSPSKSVINNNFSVEEVVKGYEQAGVCGISVLTDANYFGGSLEDLVVARAAVQTPLLRKEFVIDPYQIIEAKAHGADFILLIAAVLTQQQIHELAQLAQSLGLEVLVEIHNEDELQKSISPNVNLIGVNNRNLKTFEVGLHFSELLADKIPTDFIKISESGISDTDAIKHLQQYGYQGFLIGENFMKTDNAGAAAAHFIQQLLHP